MKKCSTQRREDAKGFLSFRMQKEKIFAPSRLCVQPNKEEQIMTKREQVMAVIESLGYKPKVDEEGDVYFSFQLKTLIVVLGDEEDPYVSIVLPLFAQVLEDDHDHVLALETCNTLTRELKSIKVYVESERYISASCEFFYTDEDCLRFCLERFLPMLSIISKLFNKRFEESKRQ